MRFTHKPISATHFQSVWAGSTLTPPTGECPTWRSPMSIRERCSRWRRYHQIVRELEAYSPGELRELGIAAADIGHVAASAVASEYPPAGSGVRTVFGQPFPDLIDAHAPQTNG